MAEPTTHQAAPGHSGVAGPGTRLAGRYRLVRSVARGGMAEVWEAVDEILTRPVAVKILLPHLSTDAAFVTRFRREAVAAARLSHPHIVPVYDTCGGGSVEAIVMELVKGTNLRAVLDEEAPLPIDRAVRIAMQVADALEHAHRHGLVHRDVKPGNILLAEGDRVLVADFGIAKAVEASADLTEVGQVVGTAKYLSPEQVEGIPLDARSDVYALGVVLHEMLAGRAPFEGGASSDTARRRLEVDPPRLRSLRAAVPPELDRAVARAMARRPADRFGSAADMRATLAALVPRRDPDAAPSPDATRTAPAPSPDPEPAPGFVQTERAWLVPTALILVVAATLALVGVLLGRTDVGRDIFDAVGGDSGGPERALSVTTTSSFDPEGSGGEHDDELANLTDADPSTVWTTERYDSADIEAFKGGVGVVLGLDQASELRRLELTSPSAGWSAQIYVADGRPPSLAGWGDPVASRSELNGDVSFDLEGRRGSSVLVWITDLGEGGGSRYSTAIAEATILG